ncbi:MFS transporter [Salinispora arenicola]|uniref:MFS transporter n=1 Tax=Salinispora arenicola TaxID=168697 RepID=UPI0003714E18|nr:MFS transporter [Salinispora arenicola]
MRSVIARFDVLPSSLVALVCAGAIQAIGRGFVLPFTLLYLHEVAGLSLSQAGIALSATTFFGLLVGPAWGAAIDRWGARAVMVAGAMGQAASLAALATGGSLKTVLVAMAVLNACQAATYPSQATLVSTLADGAARAKLFGLTFFLNNFAVGVAGGIAGWVVGNGSPNAYRLLYGIDSIAFVAAALVVAVWVPPVLARRSPASNNAGYAAVLRLPAFRRSMVVAFTLTFLGPALLQVSAPLLVEEMSEVPAGRVSWIFIANTVVIVVLQPLLLGRLARLPPHRAVMTAAALGIGATVVVAFVGAVGLDGTRGFAIVAGVAVMIALAEVVTAPALGPLVNTVAPDHLRGRFNAGLSFAFGLAFVACPMMAGVIVDSRYVTVLVLVGVLLVVATVQAVRRLAELAGQTKVHEAEQSSETPAR